MQIDTVWTVLITASAYGKYPGDIKDHQDQSNIPQLQPWKNDNNFVLETNVARPMKLVREHTDAYGASLQCIIVQPKCKIRRDKRRKSPPVFSWIHRISTCNFKGKGCRSTAVFLACSCSNIVRKLRNIRNNVSAN